MKPTKAEIELWEELDAEADIGFELREAFGVLVVELLQSVALAGMNLFAFIDRKWQNAKVVDGRLKCRPTPPWIAKTYSHFSNMKTQIIYTDGATKGFNGKLGTVKTVGLGVHIPNVGGFCKAVDGMSNNEAEFKALIWGMELATERGIKDAVFLLDSKIVVKRANGNRPFGKWKNERMDAFQDTVVQLAKNFDSIEFKWVPRERNFKADAQSKKALYQNHK